ncbi:MAG: MmgE/PrpD family protein [Microvirga sp.]|nr:MmgE/PrpD family protein [Microvirga sp.]
MKKVERDEAIRAGIGRGFSALGRWTADLAGKPLPAAPRRRAALILADDIGAMIVATREPAVKGAQADFLKTSAGAEASIFAAGAPRGDRYSAAAANGMAATWCELDEGFRNAPCHAGAYVIPALLAEAEAGDLTVGQTLTALALSYEIAARCALAFPFSSMSVHPHAAFATIGAAAATAVARGADERTLVGAVTGAASMTFAGPYEHAIDGVLVRNAWTSAGAWIGMRSVDWAARGIGGVPETLYDVFVSALGTGAVPEALTDDLGANWAVGGGYHKIFACCQYAHGAIEASLDLHARLTEQGKDATAIAEIVVETHPRGMTLTTTEPETDLAAKFSMPHAAAASAVLGTGGQAAFSNDTLGDARIADLRRRVKLVPHSNVQPWPNDRPSRVVWRMRDGDEWTAERMNARGGADQPFDEPTLLAKLNENSGAEFPNLSRALWDIVEGATPDETPWRAVLSKAFGGARG